MQKYLFCKTSMLFITIFSSIHIIIYYMAKASDQNSAYNYIRLQAYSSILIQIYIKEISQK